MRHFVQDNEMSTAANLATALAGAIQLRPHATSQGREEARHNLIPKRTQALYLIYITPQPHPNRALAHIYPHATMLIKAHKGTTLCG